MFEYINCENNKLKKGANSVKIDEPIMGFVEYKGKDVPFIYQNENLQLMPPNIETWRTWKSEVFKSLMKLKETFKEEKWIENLFISGTTNTEEGIMFYISNNSSNDSGILKFPVEYVFKYNKEKITPNKIWGFSVEGKEIDYFYNPWKNFEPDVENTDKSFKIKGIKVKEDKKELIGTYKHNNTEIEVELTIINTYSIGTKVPITAKSRLSFNFSNPQNLEFVIDVFYHCKYFLYYVCKRTNIKFEDIDVRGENDYGVIHICEKNNIEEDDKIASKRIINYEYLKEKSISLFQAIEENSMYLEHLCTSINETSFYDMARIIKNFVAFEREYRNLYKEEIIRSKEYIGARKDVLDCLENLKESNSGKKRDYIKKFARKFEKAENDFGDKMSKALSDCEDILLPFLKYHYRKYNSDMIEDICGRMNELRNDSAHGNIDLEIKPIHISDFSILEDLLYVMRLKYMNVDIVNIRKAIKSLENYSIIIYKE